MEGIIDHHHLTMVSMDGPNVNLSLLGILKAERKEGGQPDLIDIGICNQRVLHNAFKHGAEKNGWELNKLLSAASYVFHASPARREDLTVLTGETRFPTYFCGTR